MDNIAIQQARKNAAYCGDIALALASLYFVAAKVLLGFYVQCMLTCNWVILAKLKFLRSVLRILLGVVGAMTA